MGIAILKRELQRQLGTRTKVKGCVRTTTGAPTTTVTNGGRLGRHTYNDTSNDFYIGIATTAAFASHRKLD